MELPTSRTTRRLLSAVQPSVPGGTSAGGADVRRTGTYKIANNSITLTWNDGATELRAFSSFDGSTKLPKAIVNGTTLFER